MEWRSIKLAVLLVCAFPLLFTSAASAASGRIVGGAPVSIGEVPWQVAVALSPSAAPGRGPEQRQICGGSLVAPTLVITAAHCVYDKGFDPASDFSVISGRTSLSSSGEGTESALTGYVALTDNAGRQLYDPQTNSWDAVLLELAQPAIGTPIQLAGPNERSLWEPGRSLLASGWGALSENGPYPDDLRATQLTAYGSSCFGDRVDDPQTSFCAGSALGSRDTCYGDSGGPLAAPMADGGYRLVGDTSYGFGRCGSLDPGAYGQIANEPMRSALAAAAMNAAGVDIVGSGGTPPTTLSQTEARENAWIWADDACAHDRFCRSYSASTCRAQASAWLCPVKEFARDRRGRFSCTRNVEVSAASGSLTRRGVGRWRCG